MPIETNITQLHEELVEAIHAHGPHAINHTTICPTEGRCDDLNEYIVEKLSAAFPRNQMARLYSIGDEYLDVTFEHQGVTMTLRDALVQTVMTVAYQRVFPDDSTPASAEAPNGYGRRSTDG